MTKCCGLYLTDFSYNLVKYAWVGFTSLVLIAGTIMTIVGYIVKDAPSGLYAGGIFAIIGGLIIGCVWVLWMCGCCKCCEEQCGDGNGYNYV